MADSYLAHHGILGQKWGVRRYQNADGTLTASGKARYNNDGKRKDATKMTDEELRSANNRLQAERQYNDLSGKRDAIKFGASVIGSMAVVGIASLMNGEKIGKSVATKMLAAGALGGLLASVNSQGGQVDRTYAGGKNK